MSARERIEQAAISIAQRLVSVACNPLPEPFGQSREEEWLAEFPVILQDPERPWPSRVLALLTYAADQIRGTWSARSRRQQLGALLGIIGDGLAQGVSAAPKLALMAAYFSINLFFGITGFVVNYFVLGTAASFIGGALSGATHGDQPGELVVIYVLLSAIVALPSGVMGGMHLGSTIGGAILGTATGGILGIGGGLSEGARVDVITYVVTLVALVVFGAIGLVGGTKSAMDDRACDIGSLLTGVMVTVIGNRTMGLASTTTAVVIGAAMMAGCVLAQLAGFHHLRFLGLRRAPSRRQPSMTEVFQ